MAVSEVRVKNYYIIGRMSIYEGYKISQKVGYNLTLRHTDENLIDANIKVYQELFQTIKDYNNKNPRYYLEKSLQFLNKYKEKYDLYKEEFEIDMFD